MLQFKLKNILTLSIFITLFLAAGPAVAQCGFSDLDGNGNDLIENEEYNQGLFDSDYYSSWDSNEDGVLTEDEWGAGTETWDDYSGDVGFSDWDSNYDNELTEDEFNKGFWNTLDDDDNNTIDQDEWDVFDSEEDGLFC